MKIKRRQLHGEVGSVLVSCLLTCAQCLMFLLSELVQTGGLNQDQSCVEPSLNDSGKFFSELLEAWIAH